MNQNAEWPVDIRISTPDLNEIMDMAILLVLKPKTEMNSALYGDHKFGLKMLPTQKALLASSKSFSEAIQSLVAVGRPTWSYFWDDSKKRIPLAWRNYILVFGDIFTNESGAEFVLVFTFKGKWNFSFEQVSSLPESMNTRLVCLIEGALE